jgi:hypothetical protein
VRRGARPMRRAGEARVQDRHVARRRCRVDEQAFLDAAG